jgi:hypothetical protein
VLVVDGVPIIDKSKMEKLLAKIAKEISRKGAPIKPDEIFMPWDDATGKSKGYEWNAWRALCARDLADVVQRRGIKVQQESPDEEIEVWIDEVE